MKIFRQTFVNRNEGVVTLHRQKKERIFALWAARKIFLVHEENLPRETAKNNLRKRQSEKKKKINEKH
jgi:hypothetical protein